MLYHEDELIVDNFVFIKNKKMKNNLSLFIAVAICAFFVSCANSVENESKENKDAPIEKTTENVVENIEENTNVSKNEQVLVLSELMNGDVYNDLTIANYQYVEFETFGFSLLGEFEVSGKLMIDEMWDELSISFDEDNNPHKNLIIDNDGFQKQLIQYCYFTNPEAVKNALSDKDLDELGKGENVYVTMKVKNFFFGGKLDGYADSSVEFVEIVN